MVEKLERLAAANIQILPAPGVSSHFFLERDGFVALVERSETGFGRAGSAGLLTGKGYAVLMWRGDQAYFVGRGYEEPADASQVAALRQFSTDLEAALR